MTKKVSLRTKKDLMNTMEMVAEGVVGNTLTTKQGDVINTSVKNVLAAEKLQIQYMAQIAELYRLGLKEGTVSPDMVLAKVPRFFLTQEEAPAKK